MGFLLPICYAFRHLFISQFHMIAPEIKEPFFACVWIELDAILNQDDGLTLSKLH